MACVVFYENSTLILNSNASWHAAEYNDENLDGFIAAVRSVHEQTAGPVSFAGVAPNVNRTIAGNVDNAVLPAWRDSLISPILNTYVESSSDSAVE